MLSIRNFFKFLRRIWYCLVWPLSKEEPYSPPAMDAPTDLTKPSLPISFPLKSLQDLEGRTYFSTFHFPFNASTVPLLPQASKANRPRLLVCHDMKGGYQDDKWVQGDDNGSAYSLWNWLCIDVFVYFSHSLVTLPPPGWTNAAHKHGVQVLGTFITEWDEGAETCKALLASKESARLYASRLAELAASLGFDGWLINIENKVPIELIENLKEFIQHLTSTMHSQVPGSLVIWYDAVTVEGALDWQNNLNAKNKDFFDTCDGIFINYSWQKGIPAECAAAAGKRAVDVYMGIDVFGRGTFGGGGYNCDVALKVILDAGVSSALFAPGWVYEQLEGPFIDAQSRFWNPIQNSWPPAHKSLMTLPFFSDFNLGFGNVFYIDGKEVWGHPWSNISFQNLQPLLYAPDESISVVRSTEIVYSGGSSIKFVGNLDKGAFMVTQLYQAATLLTNKTTVHLTYSVLLGDDCQLTLLLRGEKASDSPYFFVLLASETDNIPNSEIANFVYPSKVSFCQQKKDEKMSLANGSAWCVRHYTLDLEEYTLTHLCAINCLGKMDYGNVIRSIEEVKNNPKHKDPPVTSRKFLPGKQMCKSSYEGYLGHISIALNSSEDCFLPLKNCTFKGSNISVSESSGGGLSLNIELSWNFKTATAHFVHYNIYAQTNPSEHGHGEQRISSEIKFLGAAFLNAFYIQELPVDGGLKMIKFWLQASCSCGDSQKIEEAPSLLVEIPEVYNF